MKRVFVLGGTSDARTLCRRLASRGYGVHTSVAGALGASYLSGEEDVWVHQGMLDTEGFCRLIQDYGIVAAADASHPFAVEASRNCMAACAQQGILYTRYERPAGTFAGDIRFAEDYRQAADLLLDTEGRILLTTGIKHLDFFCADEALLRRLVVRALDTEEGRRRCRELGLLESQAVFLMPPFSVEDNLELIRRFDIKMVVTKDSGAAGGVFEKAEACRISGVPLFVIRRRAVCYQNLFFDLDKLLAFLEEMV